MSARNRLGKRLHVYNRDGMMTATDPFDFYPGLDLLQGDAPHAFYLRVELGRAEIAWQPGKRYVQDEPLKWGSAVRPAAAQDTASLPPTNPRARP